VPVSGCGASAEGESEGGFVAKAGNGGSGTDRLVSQVKDQVTNLRSQATNHITDPHDVAILDLYQHGLLRTLPHRSSLFLCQHQRCGSRQHPYQSFHGSSSSFFDSISQ